MPLGDIAGEALGGIARVVGRVFVELVVEVLLRGTGYLVLKVFRPKREPGETESAVVGLLVWGGLVAGGVWFSRHLWST